MQAGAVFMTTLMLAACGSSDDGQGPQGADEGQNSSANDHATQQSPASDPASSPVTAEGGTGVGNVRIGDEVWDFTIVRCQSLAGALGGQGQSVDDPDNVDVNFEFQPEDWEDRNASEGWDDTASIRLDSEEPYLQWETGLSALRDYNLPAGLTADDTPVTSFDISDDGQTVTGEAQFVDINALFSGQTPKIMAGTFSFSCPPKG